MISKPSWLYKPVDVSNLDNIKLEFQTIFNKHYSNVFGDRGFTFSYLDKDIVRAEAPSYIQVLKDLGVYDRWTSCVFVGTLGDARHKDSPIHVDTEDWQSRSYALNMPVINCEDSHTVFFEATIPDSDAYLSGDSTGYKTARGFKEEGSREIGRWNVESPAWVNVTIPHRAENSNPDLRLIISSRFWPEIHDYFDDADS
jgi:hypothetical protein